MQEMNQSTFNEETMTTPKVLSPNQTHMAVTLLLDTSGSMMGDGQPVGERPIDYLNKGVNRFLEDVSKDELTRERVDIAVLEFNDNTKVVQDFVPIPYADSIDLKAGGGTYMNNAISRAIDMVDERSKFYYKAGVQPYKPWIIIVSDGYPLDDVTEISSKLRHLSDSGKVTVMSLGTGDYDASILSGFSGKNTLCIEDTKFEGFFDWLAMSLRVMSQASPGSEIETPPCPEGLKLAV